MKFVKNWLLPMIIATALFFVVRPVLAQTAQVPTDVTVGTQSDSEGFSQIYYEYNDTRINVTSTRYTNGSPTASGKYITWVGQINGSWQVFLYDISTTVTTQITYTGNNLNSKVDNKGQVVWEGWDPSANSGQGSWQVFFFDGASTKQLTVGDTTLNPEFGGDYISYGRRNSAGTWRAVVYSINDNKSIDVTTGEETRKPKIKDGDIYFGEGEKFPLKVTDLFLLDFPSINESTSSGNPILEELSATPSGVVEINI